MKKSILSLSAAVALGGLGFAGSANAWVAFDTTNPTSGVPAANALVDHAAGTGHMLFTPYYTANSGLATLVNIVNTDSKNGKAVKVRFRGATNSDDVLDFTLFLSPGDVWSGAVIQDPATGLASLSTQDTSCTIPEASAWAGGVPFKTIRLPSYVGDSDPDKLAALTREGYVEVLNMADIKGPSTPGASDASKMWKAVKHDANGVAPCGTLEYADLLSTSTDTAAARSYGLDNPTGGLMGTWSILNLGDMGTFSGNQSALIATNALAGNPFNGIYNAAAGNMAFFPQLEANAGDVTAWTADPLLSGATPILTPLWFDLPDMSTPLTSSFTTPPAQAFNLSLAFAKQSIMNEYVATAAGAEVPFNTDWVVSQPTRRYHAAVNYGASASAAALVRATPFSTDAGDLYRDLTLQTTAYGPQACMMFTFASTDREEKAVKQVVSGGFSPGSTTPPKSYCGEVFVAQFGAASTLHAAVTNRTVTAVGEAGWASLNYAGMNFGTGSSAVNFGLPMVGYAATLFQNSAAGTTFGQTFPHRYTGSVILP